ncbi:MAG: hypothetical protein AAB509_02695 [Patescibacteria group bacterium]
MDPIVLNEFGESLCVDERFRPVSLFGALGTHGICGGGIHAVVVSKTHRVLFCDRCKLRMHIPIKLDDYPGLRQWCALQMRAKRYQELQAAQAWGQVPFKLKQELQRRFAEQYPTPEHARAVRASREEGEDALIDLT